MWKEKKTRTVKPEKHEPDTCPMIVSQVKKSLPNVRTAKSKEKIKVTTSVSQCLTTTCETSGNIMRLCVDLMPVLAAAKEPVEDEEAKEEDNSCTSKKEPETSRENDPSVTKSVEQNPVSYKGFNLDTEAKQPLSPQLVLPPITQHKPAPECQKTKKCHAPLPPISLSAAQQTSSNFTVKHCADDRLVTGQAADSRAWIDNPLFSQSRSAEFRLPDISLSSLEALLHTVTQKLDRRRRRGGDEGWWRCVQSDHLLAAVSGQHMREKRVGKQTDCCTGSGNPADTFVCDSVTEASVGGRCVNRQRSLPPLFSAPTPTLVLTMTKKNLLTSNTLP